MAPPTLAALPAEILFRICSLLESHISSLAAFSLANKRLFEIASACLASTITFEIKNPAQLSRDVETCKQLLRRHQLDLSQHVRRLVIVGCMGNPDGTTGFGGSNPAPYMWEVTPDVERKDGQSHFSFSLPKSSRWYVTRARLHGLEFGSRCGAIWPDDFPGYHSPDHAPARFVYKVDHYWQPLADLISQLPGLADVVYQCSSQFPVCLLKAMHANQNPNRSPTRLHLQIFKLRSVDDGSATIDPHEWDIITSPCLYSIWFLHTINFAEGDDSRQFDAVKWMIQQGPISSCLREVRMVEKYDVLPRRAATADPTDPNHLRPWDPITFFNQEQQSDFRSFPSGKGRLTNLKLRLAGSVNPDDSTHGLGLRLIEAWSNLTDFSLLHTLALVQPVSQEQLLHLSGTRLPELATLSLACQLPSPGGSSRFDYHKAFAAFLSGLPSLTSLEVTGWDHASHVFAFHSPRLETLSLVPIEARMYAFSRTVDITRCCLTLEGLTTLVSSFPRLTDLSIQLRRSRGDSEEIALYRCIGEHLPNLRRLTLMLDCSPPPPILHDGGLDDTPLCKPYPSGPGWPAAAAVMNRDRNHYAHGDCFVGRYRYGHIYDIFINSALDASLAREIFAAVGGGLEALLVQTCKGSKIPEHAAPETVVDHGDHYGALLHPFLSALTKRWMVEKTSNLVAVKEIDTNKFRPHRLGDRHRALSECFRRVWPKKEGSQWWFEDWESWPLRAE